MTIHVYDIEWDLVDEETGHEVDCKEEGLPKEVDLEIDDDEDVNTEVANRLSDDYGFRVKSFDWKAMTVEDKIRAILRRYFECNDNGDTNPEFDEYFSAEEAIDEIHNIIGEI